MMASGDVSLLAAFVAGISFANAYPPQGARNNSLILKDDTVMTLDEGSLRYFAFVDSEHAVARGGDGGARGEAFQTYLVHVAHGGSVQRIVERDYSISGNVFARKFGAKYYLVGGLALDHEDDRYCNGWAGCEDYFGDRDLRDGIRMYEAGSLASVRGGRWWRPDHDSADSLVIKGPHAGCVTMRHHNGVCEYDGKVSVVHLRGRYHLFVRANLKVRGGRWMQVASSEADDPFGPYLPFQLLQMRGYDENAAGNVYFASVDVNPLDADTMLGLFPVNVGDPEHYVDIRQGGNGDGEAFIGLSLSCDAVHWSDLTKVLWTTGREGRTYDQPADGIFLDAEGQVTFYVHRNVPHISPHAESGEATALIRYTLRTAALRALTTRAKAGLPGCHAASAGLHTQPPPPPRAPSHTVTQPPLPPPLSPSPLLPLPPPPSSLPLPPPQSSMIRTMVMPPPHPLWSPQAVALLTSSSVACSSEYAHDLTYAACLPWCSNDLDSNCRRCKCSACTFCRPPSPPPGPASSEARSSADHSERQKDTTYWQTDSIVVDRKLRMALGLAIAGIGGVLVLVALGKWMYMRGREGLADRAMSPAVAASPQGPTTSTDVELEDAPPTRRVRTPHRSRRSPRAFTELHNERTLDLDL